MRTVYRTRAMVLAACCVLVASTASGQQPAVERATAQPAGEVLKHIPAGCLGFAVVNNVEELTSKIDRFIKQISPGERPLVPFAVLDWLKGAVQLGEGFEYSGAVAAVMLDPQQFGFDIPAMITEDRPPKPEEIPFGVLIPGKDLAKTLAAYQPVQSGDNYKLSRPESPAILARQVGNHILIGTSPKALAAIAATDKPILGELSLADKALMARNDLAIWVNFRVYGPLLETVLPKLQEKIRKGQAPGGPGGVMVAPEPLTKLMLSYAQLLSIYKDFYKQLEDEAVGVRFTETGVFMEGCVSFVPDSSLGKALIALEKPTSPLLHRLPNMPFVFALGGRSMPQPKEDLTKCVDQILGIEMLKDLSAEGKTKLRGVMLGMSEQVRSFQFYLGENTASAGRLGIACVIECVSAEKVRDLLADAVAVAGELKAQIPAPPLQALSVSYLKGAQSMQDRPVDVISISHPALEGAEMPEEARAAMKSGIKTVFGEERLCLYVAQADKNTLAITMGGAQGFLASVLKTAGGTGKLHLDESIVKSLEMMPKNRSFVGLFSPGNLTKLIMNIIKDYSAAMGTEPPPLNVEITSRELFAVAGAVQKADLSFAGYIPSAPIREFIQKVLVQMMGMPLGPPPPQEGF